MMSLARWNKYDHVAVLCLGYGLIVGLVFAAGKFIVPLVDGADKAILAAINPDQYAPGFDEFFRALTDYSNFAFATPFVSWMVAYGLYRLFPRGKSVFTGLLALETVAMTLLAAFGKIWPNTVYAGVNVLLVILVLASFGFFTYLFHRMDPDMMRRFSRVFWLIIVSTFLTDFVATDKLKNSIARPRPLNDANKPWNEQVRIIPDEVLRGQNSFPSGHTSGTFALVTPLFWFVGSRKVRTGLLTWGFLQGMSRVYTAAHFPFCCLMGGLLGFSVGTLVFFTLNGPAR